MVIFKSLKNHWMLWYFQQLGRPWEPLEVPGGARIVLRGPLERVRRPKQRPGTARQSHRQPRGVAKGSPRGRQGIRGRLRGGLGGAAVNDGLPAVLGGSVRRSRRRSAEGQGEVNLPRNLASEELACHLQTPCILSGCGGFSRSAHSAGPGRSPGFWDG